MNIAELMASINKPSPFGGKMMKYGDTPSHSDHKCLTCKSSIVVKGQRVDDEIVHCKMLDKQITFKVSACSRWSGRNELEMWQMEAIAHVLVSKKGKIIGFKTPDELKHLGEDFDKGRPVIDE